LAGVPPWGSQGARQGQSGSAGSGRLGAWVLRAGLGIPRACAGLRFFAGCGAWQGKGSGAGLAPRFWRLRGDCGRVGFFGISVRAF